MAGALPTSRATAELILSLAAAYLLPVKGNQKTLLAWLSQDRLWPRARTYRQPDSGRGRIEHRTIEVIRLDRPRPGPACPDFPGVRVAVRIRREVEFVKTGEKRESAVADLISNLRPQQAAPKTLLEMNRKDWGAVENGLHRVRDGALAEDPCRVRQGYLPRAMAVFANLALTILRLQEVADIAAETRALAANAAAALDLVALQAPGLGLARVGWHRQEAFRVHMRRAAAKASQTPETVAGRGCAGAQPRVRRPLPASAHTTMQPHVKSKTNSVQFGIFLAPNRVHDKKGINRGIKMHDGFFCEGEAGSG